MNNITSLGLMLDVSRGKVFTIETLKHIAKVSKEFGYTYINLYIEDLLTLSPYPQYGYLRGRYSDEEIMDLVEYCNSIGLEIYPAIQTLGHLEHFFKWNMSNSLKDTPQTINVNSEESLDFIEVLIAKCQQLFKTDKINIGMDEAFDLGMGTNFRLTGEINQKQLYLDYLQKVVKICKDKNFRTIKVWSDMVFSIYSNSGEEKLYDSDFKYTIEKLDSSVELVFWNYWSRGKAEYDQAIDLHYRFTDNVSIALGVHTWGLPYYDKNQLDITQTAMEAIHESKIDDILFTMWGDDGSLYDLDTAIYGIYLSSCVVSNKKPNPIEFESATRLNYNQMEKYSSFRELGVNPLHMVWNDPITNIFVKNISHEKLSRIKNVCESNLSDSEEVYDEIYRTYLRVVIDTIDNYMNPSTSAITTAIDNLETLLELLENKWISEAKIHGIEEIQSRFAAKIHRYKFLDKHLKHKDVESIRTETILKEYDLQESYNSIAKATRYRW